MNDWLNNLDDEIIIKTSQLTVDGVDALSVDTSEWGLTRMAIINNGKIYLFVSSGKIISDRILSTFKFLD